MALDFEIAGAQIDGARDYQEDAFLITHLSDAEGHPSALVIVADGMGGHAAGNVASNMAVQAFNKHITANYPADKLSEVLHESAIKSNDSIAETVKETPALEGMGCTMVGAVFEAGSVSWASVGDSHLYLLRDRELSKINADHSYGGFLDRMAAAGTPVDAEPGLSRNMLMSAITGSDISEIDCSVEPLQLQAGDKILICSDGMDTLSSGKIVQYVEWSDSPKECADALLNAVEEAEKPKQDNTTVVVVDVVEKEDISAVKSTPTPPAELEVEDEDDDDDITDLTGDTQDEKEEEPPQDEKEEEPPQPVAEPSPEPTPQEIPESRDEVAAAPTAVAEKPKSKIGLIIGGIAAGIVIFIAIVGYVIFSWLTSAAKVVTTELEGAMEEAMSEVQQEIEKEKAPLEETSPGKTAAEKTEATEPTKVEPEKSAKPTEPAQPTEIAKAEPVPKPISATGKTFKDSLKSGGPGPEMIWIPAGSFEMGSPGSTTNQDERPKHTVNIKKFAISKYEITFTEYDKFAKATGRKLPDNLYMEREIHPVIFVSWDDAYNYTKWLSKQTGKKYRLASESEWEYAASGGTNTPFWWGFKEEAGKAHCFGCGTGFDPRKPAKIGTFKPNQFGLHDTAGNVAEWVYDCWHDNYKDAPSDNEVWEGGDCSYRGARGGSFISPPQSIRRMKRDKFKSDSAYDHVGIRILRDPD
ncbi:MAG: SUMF1/EgtB/PvdO family nonheme iron enzyme [Gammaproteobacteria bacterium]